MEKMNNIERMKMELIDRKFSQKIVDKYTNLKLFTSNFAPITSTKRIIPRMKWLELVYALPYLVLKREILNSFRRTKNVFASAKKQIWNILVQLEFPRSRHREIMKIQDPRSKIQVKPVSSSYVNLMKSRGFYFKSPSIAEPISHENSRIEMGKESAVATTDQVPMVTTPPLVVSHKPLGVSNKNQMTYALHSTSDFITPFFSYYSLDKEAGQKIPLYLKSASIAQPVSRETAEVGNKQTHLNTREIEKVPLYHTYPKIEHVTSTHTELIKERVIEKEEESKLPNATPPLPSIDVNGIADQVYSFIERKIRIEKERRGLYG
jgi:hypothetical protein